MSTKTAILTFSLLLLMAAGVVVGIYLVRQNQDIRSSAQTATVTDPNPTANTNGTGTGAQTAQQDNTGGQGASCPTPDEVANVRVDYPNCGE